ncbi:Glutamate-pyruvate aminotransferase AlaC [compost metagenome]
MQLAAAKALSLGAEWYDHINSIYAERRTKVYQILDMLGCSYSLNQVGLFVWAKIPDQYADGYALSDKILYGSSVFLTPGGIFGSQGNSYVRISLCGDLSRFEQAIIRIGK